MRLDISNCTKLCAEQFISALQSDQRFILKKHLPIEAKCHFERYSYVFFDDKLSVVYDTKGSILSLTADEILINIVKQIYEGVCGRTAVFSDLQPTVNDEVRTLKLSEPLKSSNNISMQPPKNLYNSGEQSPKNIKANAQPPNNMNNSGEQSPKNIIKANVQPPNNMNNSGEQTPKNIIKANVQPPKIAEKVNAQLVKKTDKADLSINNASGNKSDPSAKKAQDNSTHTVTRIESENNAPKVKQNKQKAAPIVSLKSDKKQNGAKATGKSDAGKTASPKSELTVNKNKASESVVVTTSDTALEYKNGYSVKKYPPKRLEGVLKRLKTIKGIVCRSAEIIAKDSPQEVHSYAITDAAKQRILLRYMPKQQTLQLQGKRSSLFGEIQVLVSENSDYKTAVNSHIELMGEDKRATDLDKQLKKSLPDAYSYLSEQSRIDLTIGMIDIFNPDVKLTDYSVLLVPPYRGLERFIYDLQRAQNIEVKMIGQAYEKEEGAYVLKSGYRKKINSVIYAEVMSALYAEYFMQRNFYAHSDNSADFSQARVISDKTSAQKIFDNLLKVINYNCKKLREIGFSTLNGKA